jgi:hypothetical protein
MMMNTTNAPRTRAAASAVLPQRKPAALPTAERQPFRVLQSGHAPAQLSLFLRPGIVSVSR